MSKSIKNEAELNKALGECSEMFVLFYASWCPYCREFLPIYEKYAGKNEQKYCSVATDMTPECEGKYSIEIVPTVIYFKNGKPVKRLDGVGGVGLTEKQLAGLIKTCESKY